MKNILLESVSHHILPQMLVSPLWVDLNDVLKDYLKYMDDHLKESADLTSVAYHHRNYSKVCCMLHYVRTTYCLLFFFPHFLTVNNICYSFS